MDEFLKKLIEILSDNSIELWTLILTAASTLLWGIYVTFTIKTFREIKVQTLLQSKTFLEIKEQTILQSRSFLVVKPKLSELTDLNGFNEEALRIHEIWKKTLKNNLPDALKQEECFSLQLMNRGKSDIIKWTIRIKIEVTVGKTLKALNVSGNIYSFELKSNSIEQIGPNQELCVKIIPYGFYPKADISWTIDYEDIRNNKDAISENNLYSLTNLIAYEYNKE